MTVLRLNPPPRGLRWRSSTTYIITTITLAIFTDLFLYGLIVPIIPFILSSRLQVGHDQIQRYTSLLLASYAGASFLASLPVGYIADRLPSRQLTFLVGLSALFLSTALLSAGQTMGVLVLARVFQGISASAVWTTGLAMIVDTVGSHRLGVVVGGIFSIISIGQLVAPVFGGIVYEHLGEAWVFGMGFLLLTVDFILRLFIIEKRVARRFRPETPPTEAQPSETSRLLSAGDQNADSHLSQWKLSMSEFPSWAQRLPVVYLLFKSPRLLTAQALGFTQALILAVFDATLPIQSLDLFSFTPLSAGLIFIPLLLPELIFGPVAGLIVDRRGTKWPTVVGLIFFLLPLSLFGFVNPVSPDQDTYLTEIIKFSLILSGCGIALATIGSQSIVDASIVIGKFEQANPGLFPEGGPYAQLYAVNGMVFSLGLTLGPIAAGWIKETYGYATMNICVAMWCLLISIPCALFMGGRLECVKNYLNCRR